MIKEKVNQIINKEYTKNMNELLLYRTERKIMSPFCEISFVLENGANMEDFLESLDYWGVKYTDMNKEYANAMQAFDRKREELGFET